MVDYSLNRLLPTQIYLGPGVCEAWAELKFLRPGGQVQVEAKVNGWPFEPLGRNPLFGFKYIFTDGFLLIISIAPLDGQSHSCILTFGSGAATSAEFHLIIPAFHCWSNEFCLRTS